MTARQALQKLAAEWNDHIKSEVGGNSNFEERLTNAQKTVNPVYYNTALVPCEQGIKLLKRQKSEFGKQGVLYERTKGFPSKGKCWALTWPNMLSGGYVAYVDAHTGEVIAIVVLLEG